MPVRKLSVLIIMLVCGFAPLSAAENIDFTIRFFDRRVYYLAEDPIYVQITLSNNGPDAWRFSMADERAFTVDFDARTVSNRALEAAPQLVRRRATARQVFFREIVVQGGESFSFVEDIRDYVSFSQAGSYVVQARLYPALYRPGSAEGVRILASNRLTLNLRPPSIPGEQGLPWNMDEETGAVLVRSPIPPDEVIAWTLEARQHSQWEKFFLYLDLESLLTRDGARRREWLAQPEEGRRRMLARYRQDLQSASIEDGTIALIPQDFRIERTTYNETEGTVVVLERFTGLSGSFVERKRYTYTLRRHDGIWVVTDYVVMNLGTE